MFQYECEKRPPSSSGSSAARWERGYPRADPCVARRPLPPRPIVCDRMPTKTSVPLRVWVIASSSCFAVCAVLVLATVVITKWGSQYNTQLLEKPEPVYSHPHPVYIPPKAVHITEAPKPADDNDLEVLDKLKMFKNIVATRGPANKKPDLTSKPQMHPLDDTVEHVERRIEKKDKADVPVHLNEVAEEDDEVPEFKPTLPDVIAHGEVKLPDGYMLGLRSNADYEEYYTDDNLYDDYMQSNTMTNYLIEKVQELHDWINSDPDFENVKSSSDVVPKGAEFTEVLQALNQSLLQGDASIVMNKLKDIYFGDNYTSGPHGRRMIISNSTDLLSFGILTLDIMLLHNIQLMAWENQESSRAKMLKDPDVFAFNALFMEPSKVEAKQNEVNHHDSSAFSKRQNLRQDMDAFDIGKGILENVLDVGMSAARAAIHLGRAYKNTKVMLTQLSNRDLNANIQSQLSRNIEGNRQALSHLQTSFGGWNATSRYTELDCMWLLYCRNLAATAKLNAPYGAMARINGMALRMLTGELSADRALETMLYEAMSGWTDLKCNDMFPRCSKANAASVVMETILQPLRKP